MTGEDRTTGSDVTNPYSPSELPAERDPNDVASSVGGNPYIHNMFLTQRIALITVLVYLALGILVQSLPTLPTPIYQLAATICFGTLCVFWYFVFRAAAWNHNVWIGFGHAIITACLTPCLLIGLVLIPILIRGDAERLAGSRPRA